MINTFHAIHCVKGFYVGLTAGEVAASIFGAFTTWDEKNLRQYYRGVSDGFDDWYLLCYLMMITRIIYFAFGVLYVLIQVTS